MSEAVAAVVREARLTADAGRRRRFTVAHQQAVLALRARTAVPWAFTVPLLRAAVVLDRTALATVTASESAVTFAFVVPAAPWDAIDLSGLLSASLLPDRGHDPSVAASIAAAWQRLIGRAVNGAMGEDVPWVELVTPIGGRRWERGVVATGQDPYGERMRSEPTPARTFELRVGRPEPSIVRRLWSSTERVVAEIARLWSLRLGRTLEKLGDGVRLVLDPTSTVIDLGGFATWRPDLTSTQLLLERDGVGLAQLMSPELADPRLRGRVDCPALTLDIDEKAVVADDDFELLVAWLLEALAAAPPAETALDGFIHDGEVLYAWRHRVGNVPMGAASPVLPVWPGELAKLRARAPELAFVPFAAFREADRAARADFAALEQGSLGAIDLEVPPFELDDGASVRVRVVAYIHRYSAAEQGVVEVLAWRRRVARVQDPGRVVAGITVVAEIAGDGPNAAAIVGDTNVLDAIADHARAATIAAQERLFAAALDRVGPNEGCWSVPFIRFALEAIDAVSVGLRFAADGDTLRLAWDDAPTLSVHIGTERDGTARTLRDALVRARDVGGVVIAAELERWYTLESNDPELSSWIVGERGRGLLQRVLGPAVVWEMPIVPEAQPRPLPIAAQPNIVLGRDEVAQKLGALVNDRQGADHLLAHLLAMRAAGSDTRGLEQVPLLRRYDPRALTPRNRIALANALAEHTLRVAPFGAVGRWLSGPVLEVSPAIAAMLHETVAATPAEPPAEDTTERSERTEAPRGAARRIDPTAMLVRVPIADRLCAGALHLTADPSDGIELWAKGLRVGAFRLPSPLRDFGGRLWLTDAGIEAGHAGLVKVALAAGQELVQQAVNAVGLSPPRSRRREVLESFIARAREHVRTHKDFMHLGDVIGLAEDSEPALSVAPLRAMPAPRERLQTLLRWALGRPLQIETAWLSWRAVKVLDAGMPGRLELGSRHDIVGKALDDRASLEVLWPAAIVVVAGTLAAAPALAPAEIALARILATARATRLHSPDAP